MDVSRDGGDTFDNAQVPSIEPQQVNNLLLLLFYINELDQKDSNII
jgi:hypothetical protein